MLRIVKVLAELRPYQDIIVQPFTGRLVRQVLFKVAEKGGAERMLQLLSSRQPYKPFSFTPLYLDERPLYKTLKSGDRPLMLRRDRVYSFSFSLILKEEAALSVLMGLDGVVELYRGRTVEVLTRNMSVYDERIMGVPIRPGSLIALRFETPTLLQLPKIRKRAKLNRYILFPLPSLMVYSLKQGWNSYAEEKIKLASWRANYSLLAVDYSLKPVTAVYDEKRRVRGFTGIAVYKVMTRNRKALDSLSKLLHFAELMNIGKSRSIGFGVVKVLRNL